MLKLQIYAFLLWFLSRHDIAKNMEDEYGNITAATKVKQGGPAEMKNNDLYST